MEYFATYKGKLKVNILIDKNNHFVVDVYNTFFARLRFVSSCKFLEVKNLIDEKAEAWIDLFLDNTVICTYRKVWFLPFEKVITGIDDYVKLTKKNYKK